MSEPEVDGRRADVGSVVRVRWLDDGGEDEYTIVQPQQADFRRALVSALSPFAEAVLGRSAGETVTVQMARRASRLTILSVSSPPLATTVVNLRHA